VIVADERVALFVSQKVGKGFVPPFTAMGIEQDGEIICGCIFNVFEGTDCHVSIAGSGWTRSFCREVGRYVFDQLGYIRMTALTEAPEVVGFAERLGGQVEGLLRNHFGPGRDAFVIGLLREEYKFRP
jgi:RimJ/RimL family protein N-acetyltransferase